MDLSICIPVYNQDVNQLASDLSSQCEKLPEIVEIILIDDQSKFTFQEKNQKINDYPFVTYSEIPKNVGRSAIRNLLAQKAKGEFLIFLDCDSEMLSDHFVSTYFENRNCDVIVGGRVYSSKMSSETLHWKYGSLTESKDATSRESNPYSNFHSNNFWIRKDVFNSIQFNEELSQYGHEDTYFGFELEEKKIHIMHIENPVLHGMLDDNRTFVQKTEKGLQNLLVLNKLNPRFKNKSGILRSYLKLEKSGIASMFGLFFKLRRKQWRNNLESSTPSLFIFKLYKLGYLCSIAG